MKKCIFNISLHSLFMILAIECFLSCTSFQHGGEVRLHGIVIDNAGNHVELSYDGLAASIGTSRNIMLTLDEHGRFDTTFYLEKPEYYRLKRNTLYLTPGDDLECNITTLSFEAKFKGKGAIANEYMKGRLFPKGGSYIEGGGGLKKNFEETRVSILERAKERREQLKKLKNVSSEFKDLENARITADIINSYCSYPRYARSQFKSSDLKQSQMQRDSFRNTIYEEVRTLAKQIDDKKYLNINAVRHIFFRELIPSHMIWSDAFSKELSISTFIKELLEIKKIIYDIQKEPDSTKLQAAKSCAKQQKNKDIRKEIEFAIQQVKGIYPGSDAFDLQLFTPEGKQIMLSQLKGRYLYIDFWATWCGPCCHESPFFEELSQRFDSNEILFIPISTDEKREAWLKYLKEHPKTLSQYNSFDPALTEKWNIRGIPRFVLIDKNFKIVNANAPRPSEAKTENYLKEVLLKQ